MKEFERIDLGADLESVMEDTGYGWRIRRNLMDGVGVQQGTLASP
jgi:hypothetical protein